MNKLQIRDMSLVGTVITHMHSNESIWKNNPLLSEEVTSLEEVYATVQTEGYHQIQRDAVGFTKVKNAQLALVSDLTYQLVQKVRPFARKTNNMVLLHAVDHSRSELRASKGKGIGKCQLVLDSALEYIKELAPYKVTKKSLDELQEAIDKYKPMEAQRNHVEDFRKTATININSLLSKAKEHLKNLDDLIPSLISEQDFVTTYFECKKVDKIASRKSKSDTEPPAMETK